MKYLYTFFALILLSSCESEQLTVLDLDEEKICDLTGSAIVKFTRSNSDGSEDFYYLEFMNSEENAGQIVFPKGMDKRYEVEGEKVEVSYRTSKDKHEYIVCLAGHTIDPDNPDVQTMAIIDICETKPLD